MGKLLLAALAATTSVLSVGTADARPRWTETRAKAWYASQPWLVGANVRLDGKSSLLRQSA